MKKLLSLVLVGSVVTGFTVQAAVPGLNTAAKPFAFCGKHMVDGAQYVGSKTKSAGSWISTSAKSASSSFAETRVGSKVTPVLQSKWTWIGLGAAATAAAVYKVGPTNIWNKVKGGGNWIKANPVKSATVAAGAFIGTCLGAHYFTK